MTNKLQNFVFAIAFLIGFAPTKGQDFRSIQSFNKIIVSPHIQLRLIQGSENEVKISASGIDPTYVNIDVNNGDLHIYLDKAKFIAPQRKSEYYGMNTKESVYKDVLVIAYVTYTDLEKIEMRGSESMYAEGEFRSDRLTIALYGEVKAELNHLKINNLKIKAFGENRIFINDATIDQLTFRSFGENKLGGEFLEVETLKSTIFGEGKISATISNKLKVNCLGESEILFSGNPLIYKGLVLGETDFKSDDY